MYTFTANGGRTSSATGGMFSKFTFAVKTYLHRALENRWQVIYLAMLSRFQWSDLAAQ